MVYDGHIEKGVVVVNDPVYLPKGTQVKVEILPLAVEDASDDAMLTLYDQQALLPWTWRIKIHRQERCYIHATQTQ
jgi:hypothetical protein